MKRLAILLPLLLAGCGGDITPYWHANAMQICKNNGGYKEASTYTNFGGYIFLNVSCEDGAKFKVREDLWPFQDEDMNYESE